MSKQSSSTTRLILCDDHEAVRNGIRWSLKDSAEFEVIGECASGDDVVPLCLELEPELVILDIRIPGMPADEVLFHLKNKLPHAPRVMIYSASDHRQSVIEYLRLGADSFVVKAAGMDTFMQALRELRRGRVFYDPAVSDYYREHLKSHVLLSDGLSAREREVLALIAQGLRGKDIADKLYISASTVEWHSDRIKKKTRTRNVAEMTLCAVELGLV